MDHSEYCREIETYLCRKNDGHLIRIVGPAFEQVCGWAERGVPLKIAFRGIDRCCERHHARGPRRRPLRVEFCEADILELFDDWRRAIGVSAIGEPVNSSQESGTRKPALAAHIERAIARLVAIPAGAMRVAEFAPRVDRVVRELDALAGEAKSARGERRSRILDRLAELDGDLLAAARDALDPAQAAALKKEADAELTPFKSRMAPDVLERAVAAALDRLTREAAGLPSLMFD
jgi:hypothetical protein